jgi:hypothetical protein
LAGIKDIIQRIFGAEAIPQVNNQPIKTFIIGSPGTKIYSGYIQEDYLSDIQGIQWADKADMMRRSDSIIRMALTAVKLPLLSANWFYSVLDDSEMALKQKVLLEQVIFKDLDKSFIQLLNEILTCLPHGYSLFEKTYKPVLSHPELGPYNSLKSLSWRSQRTIERWNIEDGKLTSVYQQAFGDVSATVDIPAEFLVHFCPEREGDNFEGISLFRPMYGNWLRKNHFLKLLAAGLDKHAIPTPTLEIPEGKENSVEYSNAVAMLEAYTASAANYMTYPQGWKLDVFDADFDADKVRKIIDSENSEIMSCVLASFLLMGQQGNTGNRALGGTLSDFFALSIQYIADHIIEVMDKGVHRDIISLNFGPDVPLLVELKSDGLKDLADEAFSTILGNFMEKGAIKTDRKLEEFLRKKLNLPEIDEDTREETPAKQAFTPYKMSEKLLKLSESDPELAKEIQMFMKESGKKKVLTLASKQKRQQGETQKLIISTEAKLKEYLKSFIPFIGTDLIEKIMKLRDKLPDSKEYKAALDAEAKAPNAYYDLLQMMAMVATVDAKEQVFALTNRKLSEFRLSIYKSKKVDDAIKRVDEDFSKFNNILDLYLSNPSEYRAELNDAMAGLSDRAVRVKKMLADEFDLSPDEMSRIVSKTELLIDTQVGDIKKAISLTYQTAVASTDSETGIRFAMDTALEDIEGGSILSGASILASQAINEARFDAADEISDDVESYTFIAVDDDRTTEVCSSLDGRTFKVGDPDLAKYSPPLHYNCRSYLAINMKSFKDNPEITEGSVDLSDKIKAQANLKKF